MVTPEEIQALIEEQLGPMINNPYTGIVNAQMLADKLGITYDEAKSRMRARREYAGKRNELMDKLQSMGFSLEDMGFKNKHEEGKSAFDKYGAGGIKSKQGIMNGWEYNWQTGM
jgi:hypothetical protein